MNRRSDLIATQMDGDLYRGGWQASGLALGDTDAVVRGLNWRILGLCESGWLDPEPREAINCHVLADPDFSFDRYSSQATFQAGTADRFLAGESIQDISFTEQATPANSHQMTGLNLGKIVDHILKHHCNYVYDATGADGSPDGKIVELDIDTTTSTPVDIYNVRYSDNLWRTLQQIGGGEEGGGEFYRPYFDRRNKFWYTQAPPFRSPQPASKGTLTTEHVRGTVTVKFHNSQPGERVGQVSIVAIKNSTTVYESVYPADPEEGKILRPQDGIWANSQARADLLAERLYRWKTRLYTISLDVDPGLALFGDDGRGLDLGERLLLTYDGPAQDALTGAGVHLDLDGQSMFVYKISLVYDAAGRVGRATLTLEHDNS